MSNEEDTQRVVFKLTCQVGDIVQLLNGWALITQIDYQDDSGSFRYFETKDQAVRAMVPRVEGEK